MAQSQQTDGLSADDIRKTLSNQPQEDGAVYLLPDLKKPFISFSWFVVLPNGDIRMNRWEPQECEEVTLVKEKDLTPATNSLHMWKQESIDGIIESHLKTDLENGRITEIKKVGTMESVNGTLLFNLDSPDEHTSKRLDRL